MHRRTGDPMDAQVNGQHFTVDAGIFGGRPVFRGTTIAVSDVLEVVAEERNWDDIIAACGGAVTREAIAEAVRTAARVFVRRAERRPSRDQTTGEIVEDAPPREHERVLLGKHVVVDTAICHGQVTFVGTRIFVESVLDDVSREEPWPSIVRNWHDSITHESIAEAIRLTSAAWMAAVSEPAHA